MWQGIARQLRSRRFENGALRIDNVKVSISLDEQGVPYDCSQFVRKEANEMIEEVRGHPNPRTCQMLISFNLQVYAPGEHIGGWKNCWRPS